MHLFILSPLFSWYPGILNQSHIIWVREWTPSYLHGTATFFLEEDIPLSPSLPQDHKHFIATILSKIHSYVLVQSGTTLQAGVRPTTDSQPTAGKTGLTGLSPCDYLLEKMSTIRATDTTSKLNIPYVGPCLMDSFMRTLCRLYREKSNNLKKEASTLR